MYNNFAARVMSRILGYSEYRHFKPVIDKAKVSCKTSGYRVDDQFEDVLELIIIGKGGKRAVDDVFLWRYACYHIVQNASSEKEVVALGQTYFAIQTRKQEIVEAKQYNELETEEEKRLFLREEMKKHNKHLPSEESIKKIEQRKKKQLSKGKQEDEQKNHR